ncbi:MAG TPA: T9SS type A sorting domain-containing protein [Chitinophagaceae bacterium]|nr:T9SS type A sorting domain-containing protein [Chitinophagaceae bacterium]
MPYKNILLFCLAILTSRLAAAQAYNTGNMYVSGNAYINCSFANESSASYLNNGLIYISGDFTNNQASMAAGTSTSSGTIYFNGSSLQTLNGTQPCYFYGVTINSNSHVKMNANLYISGLFKPQSGNLRINGNALNMSGTIDNTVSNTGAITADGTASGTSSLIITGTGNMTGNLTFTAGSQILKNFTLNRTSSGLVTLGSNLSIGGSTSTTNNGIAAMTAGALAINGYTLDLNGTVTGSGSGTFTGSSSSSLTIGGDLSTQLGTIYFTSGAEQLNSITINRANGSSIGNAVLGTALTVNSITLTKGVIATGDNLFTWNKTGTLTAPNTPYVAHTSSYINSFIATCDASGTPITPSTPFDGSKGFRINNVGGSTDVYFPVGSSFISCGTGLNPSPNRMMLNNTGTTDNFTVVVNNTTLPNTSAASVSRVWYVKAATGTGITANMRLFYTKRDPLVYPYSQSETEASFLHNDGRLVQEDYSNAFLNLSNATADIPDFTSGYTNNSDELYAVYTIGNSTNYLGAATGITGFTRFSVVNYGNIILPITFIKLAANRINNAVKINFTTAQELNVLNYDVQKSSDAVQFASAGKISALNNGSISNEYFFTDEKPLSGISYYRIKAIDKNARVVYSNIVKVNYGEAASGISIYPNPVTTPQLTTAFANMPAGIYHLLLRDALGNLILDKTINHQTGNAAYTLQLPASLAKGVFILSAEGNNMRIVNKVMVQW